MIKIKYLILIALLVLFVNGCNKKNVEGQVVKAPSIEIPMNTGAPLKISDVTFVRDTLKVKLANEKLVDAIATKEQLYEALLGKTKATLEKSKGKWRVIKLE